MHAKGGAFFPSLMREDPLSVAFNHAAAQFGAGKIDCCLLERLLLGCKIKVHWLIQAFRFSRLAAEHRRGFRQCRGRSCPHRER